MSLRKWIVFLALCLAAVVVGPSLLPPSEFANTLGFYSLPVALGLATGLGILLVIHLRPSGALQGVGNEVAGSLDSPWSVCKALVRIWLIVIAIKLVRAFIDAR